MQSNFISFVKINNFRLFDNLEIKNLKRVNLIGGKNNIGKTALLEAINLNVSTINFNAFVNTIKNTLHRRYNNIEFDIFKQNKNSLNIKTDKKDIVISYANSIPEPIIFLEIDKNKQGIPLNNVLNGVMIINQSFLNNINYISSGYIDINTLSQLYSRLVSMGKDEFIDKSLQLFDSNILSIRQIIQNRAVFKVKVKNSDKPILLSSLGEGVNRFMAIICALWANENSFLFIDEIENGIHYTNYTKLWDIIFEISKEANCQVFITTHSKECIESFNKASDESGTYIELYKNKKDEIVAKQRDTKQLEYSLTHNGSFRGE